LIVSEMTVIMGVDPGSACTGYGIVKTDGIAVTYVASGVIELAAKTARYQKLCEIHRGIGEVIRESFPDPTAAKNEAWVAVATAAEKRRFEEWGRLEPDV